MLSLDANFRLKSKERGVKDIHLGSGYAYLVEDGPFKRDLAASSHTVEVRWYHKSIHISDQYLADEYLRFESQSGRPCKLTL